jgi:hypothetical protein
MTMEDACWDFCHSDAELPPIFNKGNIVRHAIDSAGEARLKDLEEALHVYEQRNKLAVIVRKIRLALTVRRRSAVR